MSTASGSTRIVLSGCALRPWQDQDEASLLLNAKSKTIWLQRLNSFPNPFTRMRAQEWIRAAKGMVPPHHLAVEVDDTAVGGLGLRFQKDVYRRSAELGYWL